MSFTALFYVEQNYAYAILRPLQVEILAHGGTVHWLLVGQEIERSYLRAEEATVPDAAAAIALNPAAVFVPGDRVPSFIPGLKVQVFHGLNEDKRGNIYPERGLFDLYCTEGPGRTAMLQPLAQRRAYFRVCETGWLKLDSLFSYEPSFSPAVSSDADRPTILFASTFTPRLSAAEALYSQIKHLSGLGQWKWLVTLHPKMAAATVAKYRSLAGPSLEFCSTDQVISALHRADVMVCDNSSILQEFLLLNKPVVTFKNRAAQACLLNIEDPALLQPAIESALNAGIDLKQAIKAYGASVTPFLDGRSAQRVYQAALEMIESDWQDRKPANFWRNWKMRRQLKYFTFI
ncbi:CDP-glycerol glycerophosphotransferase family protein [Pseudomonadales bacterium]|nr:CDP-glycerol glycerophosphotransferase family protein [Pseudomonadales bacterium]